MTAVVTRQELQIALRVSETIRAAATPIVFVLRVWRRSEIGIVDLEALEVVAAGVEAGGSSGSCALERGRISEEVRLNHGAKQMEGTALLELLGDSLTKQVAAGNALVAKHSLDRTPDCACHLFRLVLFEVVDSHDERFVVVIDEFGKTQHKLVDGAHQAWRRNARKTRAGDGVDQHGLRPIETREHLPERSVKCLLTAPCDDELDALHW
jgi:hypothetical protein